MVSRYSAATVTRSGSGISNVHSSTGPGTVLFEDDFSRGLSGWNGVIASGVPDFYPYVIPMGITSPYAMCLDTQGGAVSLSSAAAKRMTRYDGIIAWHSRVAYTGTAATYLRNFRFAMDYENEDSRYWWEVRYRFFNEGSAAKDPVWQVNTGSPTSMSFTDTDLDTEIPYNQRDKTNYADVTVVLDTYRKKYVSLTVDLNHIDLSDMDGPTAGSKLSEPDTYFTNGMNFLYWVDNRTNNSSADPVGLVDYTKAVVI